MSYSSLSSTCSRLMQLPSPILAVRRPFFHRTSLLCERVQLSSGLPMGSRPFMSRVKRAIHHAQMAGLSTGKIILYTLGAGIFIVSLYLYIGVFCIAVVGIVAWRYISRLFFRPPGDISQWANKGRGGFPMGGPMGGLSGPLAGGIAGMALRMAGNMMAGSAQAAGVVHALAVRRCQRSPVLRNKLGEDVTFSPPMSMSTRQVNADTSIEMQFEATGTKGKGVVSVRYMGSIEQLQRDEKAEEKVEGAGLFGKLFGKGGGEGEEEGKVVPREEEDEAQLHVDLITGGGHRSTIHAVSNSSSSSSSSRVTYDSSGRHSTRGQQEQEEVEEAEYEIKKKK